MVYQIISSLILSQIESSALKGQESSKFYRLVAACTVMPLPYQGTTFTA